MNIMFFGMTESGMVCVDCGGGSGGTLDRRPAGEEEEECLSTTLGGQ